MKEYAVGMKAKISLIAGLVCLVMFDIFIIYIIIKQNDYQDVAAVFIVIFFCALTIWFSYASRIIAIRKILYDDKKIIFILSKTDHREYRWEELKDVPITFSDECVYFTKTKVIEKRLFGGVMSHTKNGFNMKIIPTMDGYYELIKTINQKGAPIYKSPMEDKFKDFFDDFFSRK